MTWTNIEIAHADMVKCLKKPGEKITKELTAPEADLLHMGVGVSGEAGEILDAIKKVAIYRKPLDRVNMVEELGDVEFYLEGIRQNLGITREETLVGNLAKLGQRYRDFKYSDQRAQDRADKQPTP